MMRKTCMNSENIKWFIKYVCRLTYVLKQFQTQSLGDDPENSCYYILVK